MLPQFTLFFTTLGYCKSFASAIFELQLLLSGYEIAKKLFKGNFYRRYYIYYCFSTPSTSLAHTKLLKSDPAAGSVVDAWPSQITLEFDEQLQNIGSEKTNFIVVNNSVGDQVSEDDEKLNGNSVTLTLSPNTIKGPVLVFYHVVSSDGHAVEGSINSPLARAR